MKKYLQIIKVTFEECFEYRLNFLLWRVRSFISFLTLFFFWLAVFGNRESILDYQKSQMLTYVIGVAFLRSIILGSRSADLAGQIKTGEFTKLILRPFGILSYWFSRDLADKSLNVFFTICEVGLIVYLFKLPIYLPSSPEVYFWFLLFLVLALFLYFYINFTLSVVAFWIDEVWAARWLLGIILLEFFAGAFFPIDILPIWLVKIINLTPFPYLVFLPLKVWLQQIPPVEIPQKILICLIWTIVFWQLSKNLYKEGLKSYGAFGG